jgi:hypothetical protein
MTTPPRESSPTARGRLLAALYLFVITTGIIAQAVISDGMEVRGDAAATAANLVADATRWRLGYTIFLLEMVAQVATSMLFYDLLKPVNRSVARLSLILGLTGCGIKTLARLFYYAPLMVLGGAPYLAAFEPAQLEALSLLLIRINHQGAAIGLVFFGFEGLLRGWLVFRSGFLPRFLGVLSMVGGLGWLTFLWPPLGSQMFLLVAPFALLGVISTAGWLLVKGVDEAKWRARSALAAASIWR